MAVVPPGHLHSLSKLLKITQNYLSVKQFGRFWSQTSVYSDKQQQIISDIPDDLKLNYILTVCKMPYLGIFCLKHTFSMPLFPKTRKWAGTGLSNFKTQTLLKTKHYGKF